MNSGTNQPLGRVPTLTEVVVLPDTPAVPMPMPLEADVIVPAPDATPLQSQHTTPIDDEQMIQRVLADVQRQVDLMLEYRLREVLTTVLTRATDSVIRDARSELASTLRDVVARAVAQEMSRHRSR